MQAAEKFVYVKQEVDNLSVVGIAGPGDALANWEETKESVRLIKEKDPEVVICLSTNGLMLPKYKDEILEAGINHVTITINSISPKIGAKIYEFVRYEGETLTGEEAAEILQKNQLEGLEYLASKGVLVKVNMVMIKGVNDFHIPSVVKKVKSLGAFVTNIMPLIPAEGTRFEDMPLVSRVELDALRKKCSMDMKQMYHCQQCRADAIGKLTQDRSLEFKDFAASTATEKMSSSIRVAVASKEGKIIDQHFGHVENFYIYEYSRSGDDESVKFIEKREIAKYCSGEESCEDKGDIMQQIKDTVNDCKAILCVRIGFAPKNALKRDGISSIEMYDLIEDGVKKAVNKLIF
jgi:MoaA/NifB/PqqE/SkfB family radical SAM enzyme